MLNQENTGKRIQNYVFSFSDCLGKGNFSKVYRAYHEITNEVFAIKIIELASLNSKKLQQLLFSEIDVLKKLHHPNVLKCYEVFTSNRHCYIITEICNEGDLESKLRKRHTFNQHEVEDIVRDVFSGLYYLAEMNIVHRDVKVANIFMNNGRAKVADFGFAKFTTQKWKDINIGSPIYMSPEGFIDNIYGPKTDIWAFGIMLYEFFHGESPFAWCKTEIELKRNIVIPLTWNNLRSDLSVQLKEVILRCLQVNQQKRCTFFDLRHMPYFRRLLDGEGRVIEPPRIYHKPENSNVRSSDMIKPLSAHDFDSGFQSRSGYMNRKNHRDSVNQSPLGPRLDNGVRSPTVNQSVSVEKYERNSRFRGPQQANQANFFVPNSALKQNSSGQKLNTDNRYPTRNQLVGNIEEAMVPHGFSSNNKSGHTPILISSMVSFKECVNLLHYCRLLYKYVTTNYSLKLVTNYNDEKFCHLVTTFLMNSLNEISEKVQSKSIQYEGQNVWLRQRKLREVTDEYIKKYSNQLPLNHSLPISGGISLAIVRQHAHNGYLQLDSLITAQSNQKVVLLGLSIIVLWHSTRLLEQCYESHQYKNFGGYKQIENFLNKSKSGVNYEAYRTLKERLID